MIPLSYMAFLNVLPLAFFLTILSAKSMNFSENLSEHPSLSNNCITLSLKTNDVQFLPQNRIFITALNKSISYLETEIDLYDIKMCLTFSDELKQAMRDNCERLVYENEEYESLENGSIVLFEDVLEPGTYELNDGKLYTCVNSEHFSESSNDTTEEENEDYTENNMTSVCTVLNVDVTDITFLDSGNVLVNEFGLVLKAGHTEIRNDSMGVHICFVRSDELKKSILSRCDKWDYNSDEYKILSNGSIILFGELLESHTYQVTSGVLSMCADQNDDADYKLFGDPISNIGFDQQTIVIGHVFYSLSIIGIIAHVITFFLVPSLRTLPGYHLLSYSIALFLGYCFGLLGQVPQVLGIACIICGVLQQNFFLVAFFCINIMAIDVWWKLRMATRQLTTNSHELNRKLFLAYLAYSWGVPSVMTTITVLLDNLPGAPEWIRPQIGKDDICYITNQYAKTIFVIIPAFTVFVINVILFISSAIMIRNNSMKSNAEQTCHTNNRLSFVLYVRLAIIMGVIWIISVVASLVRQNIFWRFSDVLTCSQGLLVFLLFSCHKLVQFVKEKWRARRQRKFSASEAKISDVTKSVFYSQ